MNEKDFHQAMTFLVVAFTIFVVLFVVLVWATGAGAQEPAPLPSEAPSLYVRLAGENNDFSTWTNAQVLAGKCELPHYAELRDGQVVHKQTGAVLVAKEGIHSRTGVWAGTELFGTYHTGGEAQDGYRGVTLVPLDAYNKFAQDTHRKAVEASVWTPPDDPESRPLEVAEALAAFQKAKADMIAAYEAAGEWKYENGVWKNLKDGSEYISHWNGTRGLYWYRVKTATNGSYRYFIPANAREDAP